MLLLDDKPISLNKFPDGTLALRVAEAKKTTTRNIVWHYESDEEMSALYYITKHLKNAGYTVVLFMPYIPNARMDRVKNGDEIFTLKYFAEFINDLGFECVYVRDPHSNVSTALINNIKIDSGFAYILSTIGDINDKDLVMYYPDEGAMKRYSEMITDRPYAFGIKRRDWRSGEILGITLQVLSPLYQGTDQNKIAEFLDQMVLEDKEGLMANLDTPYKCCRHKGILKIKRFYTMDLLVIRCEEGTGRLAGTLGAIVLDYKGNEVKVGSGFSDEQRAWIWKHSSDVIGYICEVKYKEISEDKSTNLESLQFPVFVSLRTDKDQISYD